AAFSPDGRTVATFAEVSAEVSLWDARTGAPLRRLLDEEKPRDRTHGLSWLSDGKLLTLQREACESQRPLRLVRWDVQTGEARETGFLPDEIQVWPAIDKLMRIAAARKANSSFAGATSAAGVKELLSKRATGMPEAAISPVIAQRFQIDNLAPFVVVPTG